MKKFDLDLTRKILQNTDNLNFLASKDLYFHLRQFEDLGLTKYKKRNYENWHYWWYEVDESKQKPNKNDFTADLTAFELTFKGCKFLQLLDVAENRFLDFYNIYTKLEIFLETNSKEYYLDLLDFKAGNFKNQQVPISKQMYLQF